MSALSYSLVDDIKKSVAKGDWGGLFTRLSSIGMPLAVLLMIGLMVVPVPTWLLDLLLTLNLAVGAIMLMAAVLVPTGTRVSTFPSLLLLSTLYRLALDVSATRLILGQADAGEVIRAFGEFATGGSLIVGLVIFLIITLVQLIVISKGAERVAEVTARFVSDSIPGRQMSVDAELQRNLITKDQAAELRRQMDLEVQFYGRMTGAMQFIKGDAVAALVISAINILGGFIVGVVVRKISLGEAAETYTILTVGSGLVSQIPALVTSISAGILITRVPERKQETGLGESAATQFLALPKALMLAAFMLLVVGLAPGMPMLPFWLLAGVIGALGFVLSGKVSPKMNEELQDGPMYGALPGISVRVHPGLLSSWDEDSAELRLVRHRCFEAQNRAFFVMGVPTPKAVILPDINQKVQTFSVYIGREIVSEFQVPAARILVNGQASFYPGAVKEPMFGDAFFWVPDGDAELAQQRGHIYFKGPEVAAVCLAKELPRRAIQFLGVQETQSLLDMNRGQYGALVDTVVGPPGSPAILTAVQLSQIFRTLVEEGVSIVELRAILEAIATASPPKTTSLRNESPTIGKLVETVRFALRDQIALSACPSMQTSRVFQYYALSKPLEAQLEAYRVSTVLAKKEPEERIRKKVETFFKLHNRGPMVVAVAQAQRRALWEIMHDTLPQLVVIGSQEFPSRMVAHYEPKPKDTIREDDPALVQGAIQVRL